LLAMSETEELVGLVAVAVRHEEALRRRRRLEALVVRLDAALGDL
jgi:hypothetical protein